MSNHGKRRYVVCYDVADDKRRNQVHKCMIKFGVPLQYSVFECWLTNPERRRLIGQLHDLIKHNEDDIRIYGLASAVRITLLGRKPADDVAYYGAIG